MNMDIFFDSNIGISSISNMHSYINCDGSVNTGVDIKVVNKSVQMS